MIEYKEISSNSFKNEITNKLFTYKSYMYIHLNVCKQMTDVKLLLLYSRTWNHLTVCKKEVRVVSTKCVYWSYIFNIYVKLGFGIK